MVAFLIRFAACTVMAGSSIPLVLECSVSSMAEGVRQDPIECYCQLFIFETLGTWQWESDDEIPGECNTLEEGCDEQVEPCRWRGTVGWEPPANCSPSTDWMVEDGSYGSSFSGPACFIVSPIPCDSHIEIVGSCGTTVAARMYVECLPCQQPGG